MRDGRYHRALTRIRVQRAQRRRMEQLARAPAVKDMAPKWALVRWPDAFDPTLPACIHLDAVEQAVLSGAILIAWEDVELCCKGAIRVEPPVNEQSNPRRAVDDDAA